MTARIDVVFDVEESTPYYAPTLDAIGHAVDALSATVDVRVVRTDTITDDYVDDLPNAVVIGPGTPYRMPSAAEQVIATARERGIPLVGT